jgi:multidrug resistance efflux pump
MDLHDFLAGSLDVLALLESIEQRQAAIAADVAKLDALRSGDAMRSILLTKLRAECSAVEAELERAAALLSDF